MHVGTYCVVPGVLASGQAKSAHCTEVPSLRFPARGVAWKMVAGIPDKIRRPDQTLLAESSRGRRASRRASGRPGRARQEGQHPSTSTQARGMRGAGTKHGGQGGHAADLQTCRHGNHTGEPHTPAQPITTRHCFLSVCRACVFYSCSRLYSCPIIPFPNTVLLYHGKKCPVLFPSDE